MVAIDIEEIMETRTHSVLVVLLAESIATTCSGGSYHTPFLIITTYHHSIY